MIIIGIIIIFVLLNINANIVKNGKKNKENWNNRL